MARMPAAQRNWEESAREAHYNARGLAKICNISLRQLERDFQRAFGEHPKKWLDKQRLRAAQELLLAGQPVKSVAIELGYKQSSHFCRQFKAENKMTPSQFVVSNTALLTKCRSQITNVAAR